MQFEFKGKTVIVTGATRGIGEQIAKDLYDLGANLILTGTKEKEVLALNKVNSGKTPFRKYFSVDFLDIESVKKFITEIQAIGPIHGLVNNAGINRLNAIQNAQRTDWDDMISVNLSAPFQLVNALSAEMINQKYGRIVNVASIFSVISKEKRSIYSATKFGLHGLSVGVSNDLSRFNILCNTVSPGFVMTDLTMKNLSETERNELANVIPARRLADVTDISNVVIFLLSDLNKYITGQNILVDGGFTNI
jgi:3-oxoacyl-[acyl-carrier protein] reductase